MYLQGYVVLSIRDLALREIATGTILYNFTRPSDYSKYGTQCSFSTERFLKVTREVKAPFFRDNFDHCGLASIVPCKVSSRRVTPFISEASHRPSLMHLVLAQSKPQLTAPLRIY